MPKTSFHSPSTPDAFGLIGWLEATRVQLPLKLVQARFHIFGGLADVTVDQVFHQANPNPLDIIYTFPLPDGAAVYRCELVANNRVIRAKVMSESEARKAANEAKAAGRRAALVETIRPNLFELQLGNAQPDDLLIVRLSWFQLLETQQNRERLRIPFCPGVRYIPGKPLLRDNQGRGSIDDTDQVPDASRLSPPRITELHPDATLVSVEGTIDTTGIDVESVSSPTHQIILRLPPNDGEPCALRLSGSHPVADRDFVVELQNTEARTPITKAWITEDESGTYAYLRLRAPEMKLTVDDAGGSDSVPGKSPAPLALWILLDRSGSMAGGKWTQSIKALHKIVAGLRDDDLVWLTFFESSYQDFAERPLPVSTLRADRNFQNIERLGTAGGTELLPALKHLLEHVSEFRTASDADTAGADVAACVRHNVILITDGEVGNDAGILRQLKNKRLAAEALPVHAIGIDDAVNDAFLRSIARVTGGSCQLITPNDDLTASIAALGARLQSPVLLDLEASPGWVTPGERLPNLHASQSHYVTLFHANMNGGSRAPLSITAFDPATKSRLPLDLRVTPIASPAPRLLHAREEIETLLQAGNQKAAVRLATQNSILCSGTSFIAIDEAEKVPVAQKALYQPSMEPVTQTRVQYSICPSAPASLPVMGVARQTPRCSPPVFHQKQESSRRHGTPDSGRSISDAEKRRIEALVRSLFDLDSAEITSRSAGLPPLSALIEDDFYLKAIEPFAMEQPAFDLLVRLILDSLKRDKNLSPSLCRDFLESLCDCLSTLNSAAEFTEKCAINRTARALLAWSYRCESTLKGTKVTELLALLAPKKTG